MKPMLLFFFLSSGLLLASNSYAVNSALQPVHLSMKELPVKEFISIDINAYQASGKMHFNWLQKSMIKSFQKKMARKVSKGKVSPDMTLTDVTENSGNSRGLLSVVFSVAGLLFLFIPGWLGYLGILLSAIGIYFGIKGMQKNEDTLLALIGTIAGALALLLNVIILI